MKYVTERRMAGAPGTATSNVSSSYPRTNDVIASTPRAQKLKMGRRLKANRYEKDIEKTEHFIAVLQKTPPPYEATTGCHRASAFFTM